MLKKLITYTDFDDNERTEEFYFNLSKADLIEMELTAEGNSLSDSLQKIADSKEGKLIVAEIKKIIRQAYGVRSEDGKRFIKSEELSLEFEQSAAYSEFFTELATDSEATANFIKSVVPKNLDEGSDKTPAEIARERSEAQMQGFNKPKQTSQPDSVVVPDIPISAPQINDPGFVGNAPVPLTEEQILALNVPDAVKDEIRRVQASS